MAKENDRTREDRPPVASPTAIPGWLPRATYISVATMTVTLLVLHTFQVAGIDVDTTTLGLLALLLLLPLAPYITRLSAGGVEAEIGPREAQQLQASASELPVSAPATSVLMTDAPTIEELILRDPPMGLAKLRIELERELRRIYLQRISNTPRRSLTIGSMLRELREQGVLPPEVASPLADVSVLANRAVHGEYVPPDVAREIADVGMRVLDALRLIDETSG